MTDTQTLARDSAEGTLPKAPSRPLGSAVGARFFKACEQIKVGTMHVTAPDGQRRHFGSGSPEVHFHIHDWSAIAAVAAITTTAAVAAGARRRRTTAIVAHRPTALRVPVAG